MASPYFVLYVANGASYSEDSLYLYNGDYWTYGHEVNTPTNCQNPETDFGWVYEGKIFSHWNTESDDSGVVYEIGDAAPNSVLYAIWEDAASEKITDLTNTTWVLNDTIMFSGIANYSINFISNNNECNGFSVIYWYDDLGPGIGENYLGYNTPSSMISACSGTPGTPGASSWIDPAYKTVNFTGGDEAQNSELINWLYENAVLITPTPTGKVITLNTKGQFLTSNITVTVGNPPPQLIEFTVHYLTDSTYQAEPNMTWAEWINSEYNTDGYYTHSGSGYNLIYIKSSRYLIYYDAISSSYVVTTDTIIADHTYYNTNEPI